MKCQRGFVLITVMMALVLVAAVALMLSTEGVTDADRTRRGTEATEADYLVQAALQHALWQNDANVCAGDFSIPSTSFGTHSYTANVSGGGTTTAYNLSVDQDAWIRSDDVSRNNGTTIDSHIRFEAGNTEHALTRFNLSTLPAEAQINSAVAWFYIESLKEHPEGHITIHRVTANWTEADATWETMNGQFDNQVLATIAPQPQSGVWVQINLTAQVQAWVNGQDNYGIVFTSTSEGVHGEYVSREGTPNQRPRLEVIVGTAPASPVSIQATGTLNNAVIRTLSRPVTRAYQSPASAHLQLGIDPGEDALLDSFYNQRNYGGATYIQVHDNGSDWQQYPVIRFDLASLPKNVAVRSARLELYLDNVNAPGNATIHQLTRGWVEGTKSGGGQADGATWDTYDGTNNWTSAGGDSNAGVIAQSAISGAAQWVSWEIAPLVERWLAGEPNYGLLIKPDSALKEAKFVAKEDSDPTLRPRLTITYACECGSACLAPQGQGELLMVVVNPTTLVPADAAKKALFESWGYTVNFLSESANASTYAATAAVNDAVFISESVNAMAVGDKLAGLSIGVVSQDGDYNADLGFATGSTWPVGDEVSIVDSSHYITETFPGGTLKIYDAAMEGLTTSGAVASGAQQLASWSSAGALVVLDTGATDIDGDPTAGRRVLLPLGKDNAFDLNYLNSNGRLMVQRAIAWAMGADSGASGNLLLVVGNAGSPSSGDLDRQSLIESWGYTVTLIDDGDNPSNFDTALTVSDVVYVTEGSDPGAIGSKLTNSTVGIVNEEKMLLVELGFSGDFDSNSRSEIVILDNAHSITNPLALGATTIATSNQPLTFTNNGSAPGAQTLAETNQVSSFFEPSLLTLATNAERWGGGFAPGRRVALPWGDSGFDINSLNTDGLIIMQRAIDWAAGSGCGSTKPLALLVADASNPTVEENGRRTLLQSWCYGVSFVTASEPAATYDLLPDSYDVVYVPASVAWADVSGKLKLVPVGVVNEVGTLSAHLGFTSGSSGYTGTTTELSDNSHEITTGLALGSLAVTTTATAMRHFTNTMGPGFSTLSVRPSQTDPMLMTLDTGDELLWGGNAPDRRVMLPWGGSSTFEVDNLTADGLTILQRALEWAAGPEPSMTPIAHWKLDEGTGLTAVDSEGGHDGTLSPSGPVWVAGQVGDALQFDGSDDYVSVPHDSTLWLTDQMTFIAWANTLDTSSGYKAVVAKDTPGNGASNYWFGIENDELVFGFFASGSFQTVKTSGANLVAGSWHHLAASFDNTTDVVYLYVDGTALQKGSIAFEPTTETADLWIGRSVDGEYWDGSLDDVRIYNRALTETEISDLFTAGGGGGISDGGGGIVFEEFTEGRQQIGVDAGFAIPTPNGTAPGDLLVVAVATDGNTVSTLSPNPAWNLTQLDIFDSSNEVTFGVWWKIADGTESMCFAPPCYLTVDWTGGEQGYGWIMRFTGHDPSSPITTASMNSGNNRNPQSNNLITSSGGNLILRLGGFDDDDITLDDPGLPGHTVITMDRSNTGNLNTVSGGAGYVIQTTAGDTGTSDFNLTAREQYRTVTIAIAPQ